jgi:hypothetical protein
MFVVAQAAGAADTALTANHDWIIELVWYSVLIIAGLALIFISMLGQKRILGTPGSHIVKVKDLFSLQTNVVGLFAVVGVGLIGAALFMRFSDYRGRLTEATNQNTELVSRLDRERQLREDLVEEFRAMNVDFALKFPDDAFPSDPGKIDVTAEVAQEDGRQEWQVIARPGPGGIRASVRGLHAGDFVTLRATDGKVSWKSMPFEVPSVTLEADPMRRVQAG